MFIDLKESVLQLKALVRICILRPNSWREILIGMIALAFAPLVVLVCLLSNIHQQKKTPASHVGRPPAREHEISTTSSL
jgi:hypothetical protein